LLKTKKSPVAGEYEAAPTVSGKKVITPHSLKTRGF